LNHRRPNFDELTPDDLFRPEPVDGPRTGGTIAGEVLYSSREPIPPTQPQLPPAQQTQALPQPWAGSQQPQQASGQPEYFGDPTAIAPVVVEGATQFLPPFPQPQPGYDYSGPQGFDQTQNFDQAQNFDQGQGYGQNQGYDQNQQNQGYDQGYAGPQPYQQQVQPVVQPVQQVQQPSYVHQVSYGQPAPQQQPPQYGGGYSGGGNAGGGAPVGGGRSGSGRRFSNRAIAIAAIAACAVIGVIAATVMAGGSSPAKSAGAPSSVSASASAPEVSENTAQAQALSNLLATAANGRSAVIAAVSNVNGCQNLSQSQTDLTTAAGLRKQLIQQLALLQTSQLAHGAELVSELRTGWQASADADTHYAAWAAQSASSCAHTHKPKPGGQLAQGDAASGTATEAKAKAAKLWNVIAKETGMPERSGDQL